MPAPAAGGLPARGGGGGAAAAAVAARRATRPGSKGGADSPLRGEGPYPRFGGDNMRIVSVYVGIMRSIFPHEFGHALIGELELPSTGAEEDAVDIYAALKIVEPTMYPSDNQEVNTMVKEGAIYAALQWYYSGSWPRTAAHRPVRPGRMSTRATWKRFRNMLCIMYGGNPGVFESVTKSVGLEDRTKARCADEFNKQNRAWHKILAPHTRVGTWSPEGLQPANAPGAPVNVVFEPSRRKIGNLFAEALSQPIGDNIKSLGQTHVLPRPVNVVRATAAS